MSTHTDAWIDLARQLGRDAFRAGHPGFFLVSSDALGDEWTSTNETRVIPGGKSKIAQVAARALEVRWIGNVQDATADRISVGRGRQCDISFRHPSVSALHAHFAVDGGVLALTDAGSRNGTFVNGERLAS